MEGGGEGERENLLLLESEQKIHWNRPNFACFKPSFQWILTTSFWWRWGSKAGQTRGPRCRQRHSPGQELSKVCEQGSQAGLTSESQEWTEI